MRRFRYRELLGRLPALTRGPRSRRAERYLREHFPDEAKEAQRKPKRPRRRDGVREYRMTSRARPLHRYYGSPEEYVPYLRMSGRWLTQSGFPIDARVFVKVEPGRLILTVEDPAKTAAERHGS